MVLDDPNQLEIKLKRNLNCQQRTVRAALHRDKHTEGMIFFHHVRRWTKHPPDEKQSLPAGE